MSDNINQYTMVIERTIVDDLGVKLYDKVSAVVAELVANSYDADAESVFVEAPLGKALATKQRGNVVQSGYEIKVVDDGHGMTPDEANEFFLKVGRHRREHLGQGNVSRHKHRPVMGRKGLGKIAPFGVCRTLEIRSAGGEKTNEGYLVSHFKLNYDDIINYTDVQDKRDYHPEPLGDDGSYDEDTGTTVILKDFLTKRVSDKETFGRQLSYRFGLGATDFQITVRDIKEEPDEEFTIGQVNIPLMQRTRIDVSSRLVVTDEGISYPVTGWIGMAKNPYKNEEFAGVRVYVRGKIASITRDFGLPSGFKGEFVARSYLVGEVHADWLDNEEDLIQTHRQDILWSSDLGQSFSKWGQQIIKEVANAGREPRREKVSAIFLEKANLQAVAHERYADAALEKTVMDLGEKIGKFASEDELEDEEYIDGLREIILTVAPHKLLVDTFRKIQEMAKGGKVDLKELIALFQTSKIAQLASFGQIVAEKLKVIDVFEQSIRADGTDESELQSLLERAPWLIDSKWEPMTANRQFKTFIKAFEAWYKKQTGEEITTSTQVPNQTKRPDFIFLHIANAIKLVEIKPPNHVFNDTDWERLNRYDDTMEAFFKSNTTYNTEFPNGFEIILIADSVNIQNTSSNKAFESLKKSNKLRHWTWEDLLRETKQHHQSFLDARDSLDGQE